MTQTQNQAEVLLGVWEVLLRYRWRFVVPAFLVAAGVLGGSLMLPRKYKAEATFERRTDMVMTEITNRGVPRTFQDPRASITKEVASKVAIDELVDQLVADEDDSDGVRSEVRRQTLRSQIERLVNVGYDVSSNELDRVKVSFVHEDAELAQAVVNQLVERYIARTRSQMDQRLKQSAEFFRKEVERHRERIDGMEQKLLVFEIEHGELLPDSPHNIQVALADVRERLAQAQARYDIAQTRVKRLGEALADTPATTPSIVTGRNPELARLQNSLREARTKLANMIGVQKMTPKHPDVSALREQIAAMEREIADTPEQVVSQRRISNNPKHGELELLLAGATAELESSRKQLATLNQQAQRLDTRSASLFPVRSDYRVLSRQVEEAQRQLGFWEDNLRRVEMAMTAETGDRGVLLDFVMPCPPLHKPVSPDLVQVIMAAVVLGLIGGAVCVFIAFRTDESISTPEELGDRLSVPLLGAVSEIITQRQRRVRRLRRVVFYPVNGLAMVAVLALMAGLLYLNLEKPHVFNRITEDPVEFFRGELGGLTEGWFREPLSETRDVR